MLLYGFSREAGNCRVCWSADDVADVSFTTKTVAGKVVVLVSNFKYPFVEWAAFNQLQMQVSECCGYYGANGKKETGGNDCIMIPGASKADADVAVPGTQCGGGKGLGTVTDGASKTICCESIG